jgi:hypothetical protein
VGVFAPLAVALVNASSEQTTHLACSTMSAIRLHGGWLVLVREAGLSWLRVAVFCVRLRTKTDPSAFREQLIMVGQETMYPAHVSLWLRPLPDREVRS